MRYVRKESFIVEMRGMEKKDIATRWKGVMRHDVIKVELE